MAALEDPATVRAVLGACARRLDGKPAAATTTRRKRAVFANALGYAVELAAAARQPARPDPVEGRRRSPRPSTAARSPAPPRPRGCWQPSAGKARAASTWKPSSAACTTPRCAHRRPSRCAKPTCVLPDPRLGPDRPGRLRPRAGTEWTDDGASREERGLKHRAAERDPQHPHPARPGRDAPHHLKRYGTGPGGRLFRTARGGPLNDTGYGEVWERARPLALTPAQQASPLARRPYDLRHAAVSLWLNAGVPATEVARRAGHGVAVLLKVYANCIDGQAGPANQRIGDALDEGCR